MTRPKAKPTPAEESPPEQTPLDQTPLDQTLAAVIAASQLPTEPTLPGFEMTDDPSELTPIIDPSLPVVSQPLPRQPEPPKPSAQAGTADAVPSGDLGDGVRYQSRIEVLEAYRYPGNLLVAPDWIDRNWIGFADADPVRELPAGPILRVPQDGGEVLCRVGDYVVRQNVRGDASSRIRTEVWAAHEFERIFIPVMESHG
jgi:hypothetical protein